ncbi:MULTISPECIES: hypothetical protein [unclassified Rhodococcus (in: high G+C Gram-positive bacteria)]|nr:MULTISPECIES: hypothetical protein [unclassified Rhodococcus (in: high G+C Gram-positive bacteria)]
MSFTSDILPRTYPANRRSVLRSYRFHPTIKEVRSWESSTGK